MIVGKTNDSARHGVRISEQQWITKLIDQRTKKGEVIEDVLTRDRYKPSKEFRRHTVVLQKLKDLGEKGEKEDNKKEERKAIHGFKTT